MSEDAAGVNQTTLKQKKDQSNAEKKGQSNAEKKDKKKDDGKEAYETFRWLPEFDKSCRGAVGSRNIKVLETLLSTFVKQVTKCMGTKEIKGCYNKTKRAGKLLIVVKETIIFLNMLYQDLKLSGFGDNKDYTNYLNLMTNLMGMYLDLEIKASKLANNSLKKIGAIMTTSLSVFLDQSEDHIIEAILKAKLITKNNAELCEPVLKKFLKDGKCFVGNEQDYVRYFLAFRLWKNIIEPSKSKDSKEDNSKTTPKIIIGLAERKLNPPPQLIDSIKKMTNILPNMEKLSQNLTQFLMNAGKDDGFNLISAKEEFFKTCSTSRSCFPCSPDEPVASKERVADSFCTVSKKDFKGKKSKKSKKTKKSKKSSLKENILPNTSPSGKDGVGLSMNVSKPRVPQLLSNGIVLGTGKNEDSDDCDLIECPKPIKLDTVITLESSDEESKTPPKESNREKRKESKTKNIEFEKRKESEKERLENQLKKNMKKRFKKLKLGKKIPNSKKLNKTKDDISTKIQYSIPQSPEHGVVDSTSSNMGSPKNQVYEIHSNTGDDKSETASPSESYVANGSLRRFSEDSVKISSTFQNSVPSSSCNVDSINSSNETNVRVFSSKIIRYNNNNNSLMGPESDNTISNSSMPDSSSIVTKALTFEEKTDAESNMSEKENLTYQTQPEEIVKMSEINLHSKRNNVCKQDGGFERKNSVIKPLNGKTKSNLSNCSPVECIPLKIIDKERFKELAKNCNLKVVKKKGLTENFNQVQPGRSLLKSSNPSVSVEAKKSGVVSSTNKLEISSRYVKIANDEVCGELKNYNRNGRKRKMEENNQYYNGRTEHKIADFVPEVGNEEMVCDKPQFEISSTGNRKISENTEQKLPQRRNAKPIVSIICKPGPGEPEDTRNNRSVQNKKLKVEPVKNKQVDAQRRMPELIDEKNIELLDFTNQESSSPPTLIPIYQTESEVIHGEDEAFNLTNGSPVLDDSGCKNVLQGNLPICDQCPQVGDWLLPFANLICESENPLNIGNFDADGNHSVPTKDVVLPQVGKGDGTDSMEMSDYIPYSEWPEGIDSYSWEDDLAQGNVPPFNKYFKNYPHEPCQSVPDCCCIRCFNKRNYFRVFASRRDFFLQLRAAWVKRLREADRLKSEDDELLRRIEESLKTKTPKFEDTQAEDKEKKSELSNLPLKKRLKILAEENSDSFTNIPSTSSEKFPSYPIKPMISIAELAADVNAEKELGYIPPKILEPNAEKELGYMPPKNLEPAKPNKVGTVLPVQRQEKKPSEESHTVKNLPAFEKLVEMHRSAYLAQVKGDKQTPSSVDLMRSFMSPMAMIQPEKNKSQIAQRFDYKISKPLQKESTKGKSELVKGKLLEEAAKGKALDEVTKEKFAYRKDDDYKSTKDRKRYSRESKSRKRKTDTDSKSHYRRTEKVARKSR